MNMNTLTLRGFYVLSLILAAECVRPGVIVRVSNKVLEYANDIAAKISIQKLNTTTIKNIKTDLFTPWGFFALELTNIHCTGDSISSSSLKTDPGVGMTFQLTGINLSLKAGWKSWKKFSLPIPVGFGTADMSVSGATFNLSIKIEEKEGRPLISTSACSVEVDDGDIKFCGRNSWKYNLYHKSIAKSLVFALKHFTCIKVTKGIKETAEKILSELPVRMQIDNISLIDYSLTQSPQFLQDYINVYLKGEIMSVAHPSEAPIQPVEIPENQPCDKMICLFLTDYVANTAGNVYYKAGFFNRTIDPTQIPMSSKYQLNTAIFKEAGLSRIYDIFPNETLRLVVYGTKAPQMNTQSAGITLVADGIVEAYSYLGSMTVFLFSLKTNLTGTVDVYFNGTVLQGNISKFWVDCAQYKSDVGDIQPVVDALNIFLHSMLQDSIIEETNNQLNEGIPLPLDILNLQNTEISLEKRFISFSTDVKFMAKSRTQNHIPIIS